MRSDAANTFVRALLPMVPLSGLIGSLWLLSGCSGAPVERQAASATPSWARIYDRADVEFGDTVLIKPRVGGISTVQVTLAPLILQEATTHPLGGSASSAEVSIHFRHGQVMWGDRWQSQITYYWQPMADGAAGKECVLPIQGVRMTLDSAGAPVVWEVLGDCTGAEVIFVAQSLETAARAQFGKPLPGRRFSAERNLTEAPNTVVARVLDDGPVPMGPIVHVREASGEVATLICRCMPAQAQRLSGERVYELHELDDAAEVELLAGAAGAFRPAEALSIEQWLWPDRLNERLRLPAAIESPGDD